MPTAHINGISMYYEVHGSGAPLLFSHSFMSDSSVRTMQIPAFCQRYQFITYDSRGQGKSDSPAGEYSISSQMVVEMTWRLPIACAGPCWLLHFNRPAGVHNVGRYTEVPQLIVCG
jgi:pimeloyl-ACP methyl ester carboxylesterase